MSEPRRLGMPDQPAAPSERVQVVDAHCHFYPRPYLNRLKENEGLPRIEGTGAGERFVMFPEEAGRGGRTLDSAFWDLGARLDFMDREGITQSIVSLGNPFLDPFGPAAGRDLAREINAEFAALGSLSGGRLIGLGVLPPDDPTYAANIVAEIREAGTLRGFVSGPLICGMSLDDGRLDPVWEALEATALPLFLHPNEVPALERLKGYDHVLPVAIGFPFDTTIALARLVLSGVLQRFPRLRILAAHGGGTIPFLAARLDAAWRTSPAVRERCPTHPSADLAKLFLDTLVFHPRALRAAADLVGPRSIIFGTDHPFFREGMARRAEVEAAFSPADAPGVLGANANTLFGGR